MILELNTDRLPLLHRGKVRDSFRIDDAQRLLVVTDRISAFDLKLQPAIPAKGAILNTLSAWWFARTAHIVANHVVSVPDPQAMVVREAQPIRIEVVVRGYAAGSLWRAYEAGRREYGGAQLLEGMRKHDMLPEPIMTPTTKEESDRETTRDEALALGLVSSAQYAQMERVATLLYTEGARIAKEAGLLLADTKYEFGVSNGKLILIDEIHTPDSSRYWDAVDYARDRASAESFDKDVVRRWMLAHKDNGAYRTQLPARIVDETAARYRMLFERLTGTAAPVARAHAEHDLWRNLEAAGLVKEQHV